MAGALTIDSGMTVNFAGTIDANVAQRHLSATTNAAIAPFGTIAPSAPAPACWN